VCGFFTATGNTGTNQSSFFEALNPFSDRVPLLLRPDRIAFKRERDNIAFPASIGDENGGKPDRFV